MRGPCLLITPIIANFFKKTNINLPNNSYEDLPPAPIKSVPNASSEFINWFVGFVDAEGHFSINPNSSWTSVSFRFVIELHVDDIEILHKIEKTLGVGWVNKHKIRSSASYYVTNLEDIVRVIIPLFQEFPLQTTKHLDYISFCKAVQLKLNSENYGAKTRLSRADLIKIKKLKTNMNHGRLTIGDKELVNLHNKVSINKWWLQGFVEGEGTFGYKHLVPYFQVAQHKKNLFVLKAIEAFLLDLFKDFNTGNSEFVVQYTLNTKTEVYSLTVVSVDTLFYYILPYFEYMVFFTRKALDYYYWAICVVIHKFGYYYLPQGKKMALQISSGTNKYRYSSTNIESETKLPSEDTISKLLEISPPFDITSGLTHFNLARQFTIDKGGRNGFTVYIYDLKSKGNKQVKGSPFSTYGAGHEALGLRRGSRAIGRYIDTDKPFKERYVFSSVPLSPIDIQTSL